ncbi:hypothetical protein NL676_019364 [Syzygium grande]|nr:hypothetical protein NL676_019364 [Syzygium grande]
MADVTLEGQRLVLNTGPTTSRSRGIHHRNHRAGEPEEMASNPPGRDHSLGMAIGNADELHSTSGANIDEGELESNPREPRVGMEFDSEMAVYKFYRSYAKQTDFNVRMGKAEYSGSDKAFLCSYQADKSKEQIAKATRYKRGDMRTGCDAKIEAVGERALVSNADYSDVDRPRPAPEETQDLIDHFKCLASFRKYLSPLSSQLDVVNLFRECIFLDYRKNSSRSGIPL